MTGSARIPRAARATLALGAFCLAVQFASATVGLGGDAVESARGELVIAVMILAGISTLIVASSRVGRYRLMWGLVGVAQLCLAAGELLFTLVQPDLSSFPTLADLLWLAYYPLVAVAITIYLRGSGITRPRLLLDAGITVLVLIAVGFAWVFGGTMDEIVTSSAYVPGQLSYPILDLSFVALALVIAFTGGTRLGGAFWAASLAGLLLFWSDLTFVRQLGNETYTADGVVDAGWAATMLLMSLAANLSLRRPVPLQASNPRLSFLVVATMVPALAVLIQGTGVPGGGPAVACAALAMALMGVRLMFTLAENQRLARDKEAVVEMAGEGIMRTDREGRITDFNPAAARMLGYLGVDLRGRNGHELLHHHHADGTPYPPEDCPIRKSLRTGKAQRVSTEVFWRRDGTPIPVDYTAAPIREDGRIVGGVVVFDDVTERRTLEQRLRHQADHDPLSELYNRRRFIAELKLRLDQRTPEHHEGAVIMLDLDSFKFVNDSFGHATGDAVIREVAAALRNRFRADDVIARLGGDEFAVLVSDVSAGDALDLAGRVVSEISRRTEPSIDASAGVAIFNGDHPSADELIVGADIALYEAKQRGGGTVERWDGTKGRLAWVEQVREAIRSDRLLIHTQPIIDLRTGEVVKEEVLARLLTRTGKVLAPGSFLPTAERFGLVAELDRAVLAQAVELASPERPLAVNVSGRSIGDERLLHDVGAAAHALGPGALTFEITETAAVGDIEQARHFADMLEVCGFDLALDDFGTGLSSLGYLKHIPAQILKIDMEFVRGMTENSLDQYLVKTIVGLARRLGQKTIAEGVEDAATLAMTADLGVDMAQGYFIGRPAPATEEIQVLDSQRAVHDVLVATEG